MNVGVVLPTRETIIYGSFDPSRLLTMATDAETAGFDSVWVGDSIFVSGRFEPLSLLSAIAARTSKVAVGTAILVAPLRHPLLLAHAAATVDQISGGRLILGMGAGWLQQEFDAMGIPYRERTGRFEETIRACRALWSGQRPFRGKYWSFEGIELQPSPVEAGDPPIFIGGSGSRALRIAAELGDAWFPTSPNPDAFIDGRAEIDGAAQEFGRDPAAIGSTAYLTINLDPVRGPEDVQEYTQLYYGMPLEVMQQFQGYFVGPPDKCLEWIQGFAAAGVDYVVLRFATSEAQEQMQLAAKELLPALRAIEVQQ